MDNNGNDGTVLSIGRSLIRELTAVDNLILGVITIFALLRIQLLRIGNLTFLILPSPKEVSVQYYQTSMYIVLIGFVIFLSMSYVTRRHWFFLYGKHILASIGFGFAFLTMPDTW